MKLIITGPNGFIARNIIKKLNKKNEIILLTNKKLKFSYLKKYKKFKFDLAKKLVPKLSCDILIHAAAITPQKKHSFKDYNNVNFLSLKQIIRKIKIKKKIIFFSTSDIYKNQNKKKDLRENLNIDLAKMDNYAKSKYKSELYLKKLNKKRYPFEKIILRLPGVVGKGNHKNFISSIIKSVIKNTKIIFFGKNNKFNNIYHVDTLSNLIEVLTKINMDKNYELLNIGAKEPIKIIEVMKILKVKKENLRLSGNEKDTFTLNVDKLNKYYKKNLTTKYFLKKFLKEQLNKIS